jgi:prephenate dehydrogenase
MAESDGLMASTHLLPQLVAAALLNATVDQPGWLEGRKVAGRPYALVTAGLAYQDEIDSLRVASIQNRTSIVHALDVMIAALRGLRDDIDQGDEDSVAERLEAALQGRHRWLAERTTADWMERTRSAAVGMPSFAERVFGSALVKRSRPE